MKNLLDTLGEAQEIVDFFEEHSGDGERLSLKEMYDIALKVQENALRAQYNEFYALANVVNTGQCVPSALEKIAMELESVSESISLIKQ